MDQARQTTTAPAPNVARKREPEQGAARKRPYKKPHLLVCGDVLSLTLGGSPGINDTGDPFLLKPPAPP